ncbi:MAG: CRISPR-associated helicase Cas3' [bacterium]|nr:CRISPR-associated helicase Cas3' [Acidimicrobiia bacterium]MCY4650956.1 CRISPR-associated helicase Cas3' [bacterium]
MEFNVFFRQATGYDPYPYQTRLAADGFPDVLRVDTGCGKTEAAGLGWLWRRRHFARDTTPRWLVYTLPMRTLVDQTFDRFNRWRTALGLSPDELGIHRVMGGVDWRDHDWRLRPERDAVFVGTTDMLLSRALNRGFADSQWNWPISFGAFNSGCQWIFDEPQLMDSAVVTGRQLQAFRESFGTVQPTRTMWMSATVDFKRLETVDAPRIGPVVELGQEDWQCEPLARRLGAEKTVQDLGQADQKQLARHAVEYHRLGTLTLVVVNTVKRAQDTYKTLRKLQSPADTVLIHSRFRRADRERAVERLLGPIEENGRIVIATQVVEAGMDLSATTLITDLAPWSSMVQRAGRCNRAGEASTARMLWTRPKASAPYREEDLDLAEEVLKTLPVVATPEMLSRRSVHQKQEPLPTLRKRDLLELFDTLPDLSGNHIDVGRFIRNSEDRDVVVAWRNVSGGAPTPDAFPSPDELCRVPISQLRRFVRSRKAAAFVPNPEGGLESRWSRISPSELRPNLMVMVEAAAGGYSSELGWEGTPCKTTVGIIENADNTADHDDLSVADDPNSTLSPTPWVRLDQHLADTEVAAKEILVAFRSLDLPHKVIEAAQLAARFHDLGKAHAVFQKAIRKTRGDTDDPPPDRVTLAKGGSKRNSLRYSQRYFRHGLVSALMLLGPEEHLLEGVDESDLVVYLAASHHGRVRLGVRRLMDEKPPVDRPDQDVALGVVDGDTVNSIAIPGGTTTGGTLNLALIGLGSGEGPIPSYTARVLELLDRTDLGPFRLAWLEMLVRLADWRASANPGSAELARL